MGISRKACTVIAAAALLFTYSCTKGEEGKVGRRSGRLRVVASLFPLYDFSRIIGGGHVDVTLLLPAGLEPHSFEPRPADMATLNSADIFIYTNKYMEPWAEDILKGTEKGRLLVVDASEGVSFSRGYDRDGHKDKGQHHDHGEVAGADPHIWLDLGNARKMVGTIADAFSAKDPANREAYRKNAEQYQARLEALDRKYRDTLSGCRKRIFINGGHFTFGYLADRYGLRYRSAYGVSPDAEPTAKDLADISRTLREEGLSHIFYEELLTPRIAGTIAKEAGAGLLKLHGAHNISREELAAGVSFIDLMEKNLEQLATGLQCR